MPTEQSSTPKKGKRTISIGYTLRTMDRFTKMIQLKATMTNISSEEIVKIYRDDIWKLHRIPRKVLSDRELQFASKFMKELTKALGTKRQLSTAYHSQTDRQTERINQEIGTFL